MSDKHAATLRVYEVRTRGERNVFVRLPRSVYPANLPWIQPLDMTVRNHLDLRNPFYRHGAGRAFVARRGDRAVGRVLAHVDPRHQRLHSEAAGYFGLFECARDTEAAIALLNAACSFARENGCDVLRGPFNITAAQEIGIMTSGFGNRPAVDMVYTAPWYPSLLEAAGFSPCFRMQTFRNDDITTLNVDALRGTRLEKLGRLDVQMRSLARWRRSADMELVREVVNAAFLGNWGFVPMTREEWQLQTGALIPILDPSLVQIAHVHGVPVGVSLTVPDFNRVLVKINGKLSHPRALSLLRARTTRAAVVILFAVRKQYQGLGMSRLLNAELVGTLQQRGYRSLAITWIHEKNHASRAQAQALGMHRIHELAMYERSL